MSAPKDENVRQIGDEIDRVIDRARDEYDITYAAIIGILLTRAVHLVLEAKRVDEESGES